ncbi:MAG: hypothetical protein SF182_02980 [Deltaproteobacteria bacterium]|nr:hypothetical protein [Deltaproteobacteria bacterium]
MLSISSIRFLTAALALSMTSAASDAMVLCATRGGAVKAREACRTRETQLDASALGSQRIVAGSIAGDSCTPLTDPAIPGTCPILSGNGFSVAAYLATDAGADCCGLPRCGRCLIRYKFTFDQPFASRPSIQVTADDGSAATYCGTWNDVTATGATAWCTGFARFAPPHELHFMAVGPR